MFLLEPLFGERGVNDLLEDAERLRAHQPSPVQVKRWPATDAGDLRGSIVVLHRHEIFMRACMR